MSSTANKYSVNYDGEREVLDDAPEKLKNENPLRGALDEDSGEDDPLLMSDQTGNMNDKYKTEDESVSKENIRNMAMAVIVTSLAMMSYSMYNDSFSQWQYVQFERLVLGDNASLLNATASDPCIKDVNHTLYWAKELDQAQSLNARFSMYGLLISLIPALFANLLLGVYSDYIGRRVLFLVPILGLLVRVINSCVVAYWKLNIYWLFAGMLIVGLTGSVPAIFMGLYTYTADNTGHKKSRSFGMVVAQAILNVCFSLSHMVVGYFISDKGYVWPMFVSAIIMACSFLICFFFLKETLNKHKLAPKVKFLEGLKVVFSFYTKQGDNPKYRRKDFSLLGIVFFLFSTCISVSLQSGFLMNQPFCWSSIKIGDVTTYQGFVSAFASLVLMKLLQRFMSDEAICIVSLCSAAANRFVLAFAKYDWMIYTAFTIGMLEQVLLPIIRAILSRMAPSANRGSLLASVAVIEVATFVIAGSGLDALYSYTVDIWHGLTYFVIALCLVLATGFMLSFIIIVRRRDHMKLTPSIVVVEEFPSEI